MQSFSTGKARKVPVSMLVLLGLLFVPSIVSAWSSPSKDNFRRVSTDQRQQRLSSSEKESITRRKLISSAVVSTAAIAWTKHVHAETSLEDSTFSSSRIYTRNSEKDKAIAYRLTLPSPSGAFQETQKPVKTHLDEVNLINGNIPRYQYGITVDPVRIQSLKEFGTPEEVAARVVTAEVNRDGIFEVKLLEDPVEVDGEAYVLHYLSTGKRGNKYIFNKIIIRNNRLFVLTAQCKDADFSSLEKELRETVASFELQ